MADEAAKVSAAESSKQISPSAAVGIRRWLTEPAFEAYRPNLVAAIEAGQWRELDDAFYTVLEFGTGGRRGKMYPVGTNVLNDRTIGESARGLADFVIARKGEGADLSCAIAHDTRHNSRAFAERCAGVLAAAGFKVFLFDAPRSTPLLSFAVRELKCDAGIMITASHNPPADNGFKCYNEHGGQVIPPDDAAIIRCVEAASERVIPTKPIADALADGSVVSVGAKVDEAYWNAVVSGSVSHARDIGIVYTPMHGVGETSVAAALTRAGFERLEILASQRTPDGDFPNVPGHVSNPEIPKTLAASIERAKEIGADLVLASDPDADRIGVAVPTTGDPKGDWTIFNGNQIGVLLTAFVIKQTADLGKLRPDHYIVTTLVSSQMGPAIAKREGVRIDNDLLVGFKWIANRIDENGHVGFLFGFEESHGYQKGDHVRDKDAASGALMMAELVAEVKRREQTVPEYLDDLYIDVGHYGERQINKVMEGREGVADMKALMASFRAMPPTSLGGLPVVEVQDYKLGEVRPVTSKESTRLLELPCGPSDLLMFVTTDPGTRVAIRPSGTEPKIKFYLFARTDTAEVADRGGLVAIKAQTEKRLDQLASDLEHYINDVRGNAPSA